MEQGTLLSVTGDDVREAADRIGPYVRTTPVFATEIGGRPVTLKLENLQVTGSFKFRGALNSVITHNTGGHVVAASGGNHGLGVATAAKIMKVQLALVTEREIRLCPGPAVGRTPAGRRAGRRRAVRRMAGRPGTGPPPLPGPLRRQYRLASGVALLQRIPQGSAAISPAPVHGAEVSPPPVRQKSDFTERAVVALASRHQPTPGQSHAAVPERRPSRRARALYSIRERRMTDGSSLARVR
jgi:hypothetical protein